MKKAKIICLILAALTVISFASCASENVQSDVTTPSAQAENSDPTAVTTEGEKYDSNGYLLDDIPADLKLNTTLKVLYWEDVENVEFFVEEESGDPIKDAIYYRNMRVEERLGVGFDWHGTPGDFSDREAFVVTATNAKNNGDDYDIYAAYSMTTALLAHKGLCRDLRKLDGIDFSKPWWPEKLIEEGTIYNKLFFASGDLSTNMLYMMYTIFFNADLMNQYGIDSLYTLVDNNEWTYEKMFEMSKVVADTGSAGSTDKIYAFCTTSDVHLDPFYFGAGLRILERDADGTPVVSPDYNSVTAADVSEMVREYLHRDYCTYTDKENLFVNDQCFFHINRARYASANLGSVTFTFGVLPTPKYSADQENFVTILGFPYTLYAVSTSSEQPDKAAWALECLCSEGYRTITPALFELSMKIRYSSDNDASRMFQLIRDNISFDVGRIFTSSLNNIPYSTFRAAVKLTTASDYSRQAKAGESRMKNMVRDLLGGLAQYDN